MNPTKENAPDVCQGVEGEETNHQHGREFLMTQSTRIFDPTEANLTDLIIEAIHTDRPIAELLAEAGVN